MLRRVNYRAAATAFVFTGLWFVIGAVVLFSRLPGVLGIEYQMFVAWLLLFFVIMGIAGATLTLAALHGIFPASERAGRRRAPPVRGANAAAATERLVTPDGRPLPWSESPLPSRPGRRTTTTVRPGRPASRNDG